MLESDVNPYPKKSSMEGKELQSTKEIHSNLDGSILIVGGFDGSSWLSTMNSYYPSRDIMESLPAMKSVRSHVSTAKLNGEIYVLGGANGNVWCDTGICLRHFLLNHFFIIYVGLTYDYDMANFLIYS